MIKERERGGSRERVLTTAFVLFAEQGFQGTTTKEIARTAHVNEVTLFRTFGSKEALFREVMQERFPLRTIQNVVDFEIDLPMEELMVLNACKVLDVLKQNRHFFMMLVGEVWRHPGLKERVSAEMYRGAIGHLTSIFQDLMGNGRMKDMDPMVAARAWIGLVQSHYLFNYLVGPGTMDDQEEERILRGMADIFVNGIGTRGV
jgi:AcrR family transcriptional regulator